jgi:hypothetical protein
MVYQSAKKRKQAAAFRKAMILTFTAVAILGGATYAYVNLLQSKVKVDPETMCPDTGALSITAVLIDSSDPFTGIQQEYLRKYFDELLSSVQLGEMIQIYSANDFSESDFEPLVSLCNPGDGDEASQWTENPERIKKRWREMFDEPLQSSVLEGMTTEGADRSPLMKMIQSLSIQAFPLSSRDVPTRLIIVSDMLEHTQEYSQYSQTLSFNEIAARSFFSHITPNLSGSEVSVLYVARAKLERVQTTEHAQFWGEYFSHFGANLRLIKRI